MLNKAYAVGAVAVAVLFPAGALAEGNPAMGVGASVTVGSRDYSGVSVSGDAWWKVEDLSPYARAEVMSDNFQRAVTVGGGAWKSPAEGLEVKGGLGLTNARFKDTDESGHSLILELGAEKEFGQPVLGAEYRLTSGSVGTSSGGRVGGGRFSRPVRVATTSGPESFTAHEVSGYGRMPAGAGTLGLRLTAYSPSNADSVLSETLSVSMPVAEALSGSVAVTFEQADVSATYLTAGIQHKF